MVLTALLVLPAVVGGWLLVAGRRLSHAVVNTVACVTSGLTLVAVVAAIVLRPEVDVAWVPALGLRWHLGVDGISAPLLLLTAAVTFLACLHSRGHLPEGGASGTFHGAVLLVELGALGTFVARDAILFFVAFEVVLIPMWVLITRFGDRASARARADAGGRFLLYTAFGSTLMLIGILLLVARAGSSDLVELAQRGGAGLGSRDQLAIAALLVTGLAVKVPVFPLHTWLPPAHTIAPTAGSVLLAAVLLKMGTYGLVRLPLGTVPDGFADVSPVLAVAGVIGIVWGGLVCLVERDLKRLIAYSSVAHMGFVALGLSTGTSTGLQAALYANIAHGVISAMMFFLVGGLKERWHSADLTVARAALREVWPRLGTGLIVGLAASLGLPGLAGFWGEFFSVYAAWSPAEDRPRGIFVTATVVAAVGAALAAAYALRVARIVWVGDEVPAADAARLRASDARGLELLVIGTLVVVTVVLGVVPWILLSTTGPEVAGMLGGG